MIEIKNKVGTKAELHEQFARCIRMAEKANIDPYICVRYPGMTIAKNHGFAYKPSMYEFSLFIIEYRPVFYGDKLYDWLGRGYIIDKKGNFPPLPMLSWDKERIFDDTNPYKVFTGIEDESNKQDQNENSRINASIGDTFIHERNKTIWYVSGIVRRREGSYLEMMAV